MNFNEFTNKYNINLNEQQKQAVLRVDGKTLLLAVPGSGKTTVIVARIGYMILCKNIPSSDILILTYNKNSSQDMFDRFKEKFGLNLANDIRFGTINSFCYEVITEYEILNNTKRPNLIENDKMKNITLSKIYQSITNEFSNELIISEISTNISYIKNMMLSDEEIKNIDFEYGDLLEIYNKYKEYNKNNNLMDFDDQLIYAYSILARNKEIRDKFKEKYKYINIDESQDTSKIQHKIISLIANDNVFMVGDEDQSIYGFRGAFPEALLNFKQDYKEAKILLMETNYRSSKEIIKVANKHIKKNESREDKNINPFKTTNGKVEIIDVNSLKMQYEFILENYKKIEKNKNMAVIYRNNDSSIPLILELEKENIKFNIKGSDNLFFKNKLVVDIKNYLMYINNPTNIDSFKEIYYKLGCGITKEMFNNSTKNIKINFLDKIINLYYKELPRWRIEKIQDISETIKTLKNRDPIIILESILNDLGYYDFLLKKEKNSDISISQVQKINILKYIAKDFKTLDEYINKLNDLEENLLRNNDTKSNLVLTTIHSSKGLEFDNVILIDMIQGIIPTKDKSYFDDKKEKQIYNEEVRLFYVAITRAREELYIISYNSFSKYNSKIKTSSFVRDCVINVPKNISSIFDKEDKKTSFNIDSFVNRKIEQNILNINDYKEGCKVNHPKFGNGIILNIIEEGEIYFAEVKFYNSNKKLLLDKLTII